MPLQNRVTPFGDIIASPARGLFMGNRGGRIHDLRTRTLTKRRWASRQWIICVLDFKDRRRKVMADSYTELFFLDEVTALAAGHRPCFECRHSAAKSFFAAYEALCASVPGLPAARHRLYAAEMDVLLHRERMSGDVIPIDARECPDGTMFDHDSHAWARRKGKLLRWTTRGYDRAIPLTGIPLLDPLTPPTTIGILATGYDPVWHPSADGF